jgi:outer membrane protein OmpA-like peptidoglycan-associated protein
MAIESGHATRPYNRTYIRTPLLCGLRRGNLYTIAFYVKSRHPVTDSVGVYFTSGDFLFSKEPLQNITPSLYVADGGPQSEKDTLWRKVILSYKATGNEKFLTIGNFSKSDITGNTNIHFENHFFVFIDDVTLLPQDPNESLCSDWERTKEEIYDFNIRHKYLERYVRLHDAAAESPALSKTSFHKVDTLVLPDILFETGKSSLAKNADLYLDSLLKTVVPEKIDSIVIEGHTDNTGTIAVNQKLSYERAASVLNYINHKIARYNGIARGWGSERPIDDNRTGAGRRKNRRVEVYLYVQE